MWYCNMRMGCGVVVVVVVVVVQCQTMMLTSCSCEFEDCCWLEKQLGFVVFVVFVCFQPLFEEFVFRGLQCQAAVPELMWLLAAMGDNNVDMFVCAETVQGFMRHVNNRFTELQTDKHVLTERLDAIEQIPENMNELLKCLKQMETQNIELKRNVMELQGRVNSQAAVIEQMHLRWSALESKISEQKIAIDQMKSYWKAELQPFDKNYEH